MAWKNVQYENGKYRTSSGGGGGASNFADLDDVNFTNLQNGQVPKYNSTTQKWENADESGGGSSTLAELTDVDLSSLQDDDALMYNSTSQKWENGKYITFSADKIYSTSERVIGVYTDGKPLYQKVISGTASGNFDISTGVISTIDKLVIAHIHIKSSGGTQINNYFMSSSDYTRVRMDANPNVIHVDFGSSYPARPLEYDLILQYTKTTDTAGSGSISSAGMPNHHYSTTEQVIGTWIDGKPLYEKCVEVSNLVSGDNTIQHGISNFKKLITATGYITTTNDSDYNPIPCISSIAGWSARVRDFNSATFVFEIGSGIVTYYTKGTIILQYTKTTD